MKKLLVLSLIIVFGSVACGIKKKPAETAQEDHELVITENNVNSKPSQLPATIAPAEETPSAIAPEPPSPENTAAVKEYPEFWRYLEQAFALEFDNNHRLIAQHQRWFAQHPDYLQRVLDRAAPFLYYVATQLEQKQLPAELILLPIVESAYDPYAYSYAGAAGIWQIMPGTAKRLGVTQNWWFDGRRDIQDATEAALDYFEFLNNEFDGDWLLSVAAYNSGEGTVQRAIRRNKRLGRPTDFWSLRLPRQTRQYVPRWIALVRQIQTLLHEDQLDLFPPVSKQRKLTSLTLDSQIDLSLIAQLAELSLKEVYALNPGYNHWATSPEGRQRLLLPAANSTLFKNKLADISVADRVSWHRYEIRSGDTLSTIADRFGTTTAILQQLNDIHTYRIIAGHHLLVPKSPSLPTELATENLTTEHIHYTVGRGESLWLISRQFKVSIQQLASWNRLNIHQPLRIGQQLEIWPNRPPTSLSQQAQLRPEILRRINYPVRRGDSLAKIAKRFKLSVKQINSWNPRTKWPIYPGQNLTLYVDVTLQSAQT